MHRCCAIWNSCQRFLIVKDATLSHFLDLWKASINSTSSSKIHCQHVTVKDVGQHKLLYTSPVINQRPNNVNIASRSNLFTTSLVAHTSPGPNLLTQAQQSRFIHLPIPFKKNQDKNLRALDNIPSSFECVYTTTLNIYLAYFYPVITFLTLGALVPFVLEICYNGPSTFSASNEDLILFENTTQIMFTLPIVVIMTFISKYFTSRCPVRIYANENNEFIAVFVTVLPWKTSKSIWTARSVKNLRPVYDERATLWSVLSGSHTVNKKRMIIIPYAFKSPYYYNVLTGNTLEYVDKENEK